MSAFREKRLLWDRFRTDPQCTYVADHDALTAPTYLDVDGIYQALVSGHLPRLTRVESLQRTWPCVTPPWPTIWSETQVPYAAVAPRVRCPGDPRAIGLEVCRHTADAEMGTRRVRCGVLAIRDPSARLCIDHDQQWVDPASIGLIHVYDDPVVRSCLARCYGIETTGAVIVAISVLSLSADGGVRAIGSGYAPVGDPWRAMLRPVYGLLEADEDGQIRLQDKMPHFVPSAMTYRVFDPVVDLMNNVMQLTLNAIGYGLQFANCRNVEVETRETPHGCRAERQHRQRVPVLQYKVLVIPTQLVRRGSTGRAPSVASEQALPHHICRGHFKTYTAERPLFGKRVGTFYWPMHARGSTVHGTVEKEYRVEL